MFKTSSACRFDNLSHPHWDGEIIKRTLSLYLLLGVCALTAKHLIPALDEAHDLNSRWRIPVTFSESEKFCRMEISKENFSKEARRHLAFDSETTSLSEFLLLSTQKSCVSTIMKIRQQTLSHGYMESGLFTWLITGLVVWTPFSHVQ